MIADLRGQTVLLVVAAAPLAEALAECFRESGAAVIAADAESFEGELEKLRRDGAHLGALIHGAPDFPPVATLNEYGEAPLWRAIEEQNRPIFERLLRTRAVLGRFPRHVIALSSPAPDRHERDADFTAAGEAMLETLCRYASVRLTDENVCFNVLRHRAASAGSALPERLVATPHDVANAAVALCSGWMDSMRGQILTVDRGAGFCDNPFRTWAEREQAEP